MPTVIAEQDPRLDMLVEWISTEGDAPILVRIPRQSALAIVGLVQLATRHPEISASMDEIAHEFVDAVVEQVPPCVAEVMELGWEPAEDVQP